MLHKKKARKDRLMQTETVEQKFALAENVLS